MLELSREVFALLRDDARLDSIRRHLHRLDHSATLQFILDDLDSLTSPSRV
jgi:hypothetical protein